MSKFNQNAPALQPGQQAHHSTPQAQQFNFAGEQGRPQFMFKMNATEDPNDQQENESSSLAQFAHSNEPAQMTDPSVNIPAATQAHPHGQTASAYTGPSSKPLDKIAQIGARINQQQRNTQGQSNPWSPQAQSTVPSMQAPPLASLQPSQLIGGQTSETHLSHLKQSFVQTANTFTAFYKQSQQAFNLAYQQGKQDAFEEVFVWFLAQGQENSFKYIQTSQFMQFIRERMDAQSSELAQQPGVKGNLAARMTQEDDDSLRNLMPPPMDTVKGEGRADSHELMDMSADQCVKDSMQADPSLIGAHPQLNRKVNTQLVQNLKFPDNKKRARAGPTQPQPQLCQQSLPSSHHHFIAQPSASLKTSSDDGASSNPGGPTAAHQQPMQNKSNSGSHLPTGDNDQIMHSGSFSGHHGMLQATCSDMVATSGSAGAFAPGAGDSHQKQFLRIKRRNQIQNAMAHPQSTSPQDLHASADILGTMGQQQQTQVSQQQQQQQHSLSSGENLGVYGQQSDVQQQPQFKF